MQGPEDCSPQWKKNQISWSNIRQRFLFLLILQKHVFVPVTTMCNVHDVAQKYPLSNTTHNTGIISIRLRMCVSSRPGKSVTSHPIRTNCYRSSFAREAFKAIAPTGSTQNLRIPNCITTHRPTSLLMQTRKYEQDFPHFNNQDFVIITLFAMKTAHICAMRRSSL